MQERRTKYMPVGYDRRRASHRYEETSDDSCSLLSTIATVEAVESIFDSPSSTPDSTPSSDFGGFDGGSSGGGGSDSSW